jgi:hypothetical protein
VKAPSSVASAPSLIVSSARAPFAANIKAVAATAANALRLVNVIFILPGDGPGFREPLATTSQSIEPALH